MNVRYKTPTTKVNHIMAIVFTLTLKDHAVSLSETEARELAYELAEALEVTTKVSTGLATTKWLSRDEFDRTMTEHLSKHFAHRVWNSLCYYGAAKIVRVRCGDCSRIVDRKHKLSLGTECEGVHEHARSFIEASSLIDAYDSGVLLDTHYCTLGAKTTKGLAQLVARLRT